MSQDQPNQNVPPVDPAGIGRVTRDPVQADSEQARRERAGESDQDRQDAVLEALPEEERWDPVPGSTGHQTPDSPSSDEDSEGRSETEQLVDQGAIAAARDRRHQALRAVGKSDRSEPEIAHPPPPKPRAPTASGADHL